MADDNTALDTDDRVLVVRRNSDGVASPGSITKDGLLVKGAALTAQLTPITIADAAGTPDYALQALTTSSPYGLATAAEAITLLYVIQNLQVRLAEVEARLEASGIVTAN